MAVPATRADLIPPVGAGAGLPLTLVWADDLTDAGGAGTEGYALFDTGLWRNQNETTPSVPTVVSGAAVSYAHGTLLDFAQMNFLGLTAETEAPRLNFGNGRLEHGQAMQDVGFGRHSVSNLRAFAPATTATITEVGRHVEHPMRTHTSARPANHTWFQPRHNAMSNAAMPSYDLQIGSVIDGDTGSIGTVEAFTHRAVVDLPSNGVGATYGDNHNSAYLSSLWSCTLSDMSAASGLNLAELKSTDPKAFSSHWGTNLQVQQEVMVSANLS